MIFHSYFLPDQIYSSFLDVTPDLIQSLGAKAIFSDIDNTVATYDDVLPPPEVAVWCDDMKNRGILVVFVSNNHQERVNRFCESLGVQGVPEVKKPSTKKIKQLLQQYNLSKENVVFLGDQLFTDVWTAKRMGCKALLVPPIKDKKTLFFRFKRVLEKPYMRQYYRGRKEPYGNIRHTEKN